MRTLPKRLGFILSGFLLVLALVGIPLATPLLPKAHADGETYSWSDRMTIRVAGGMTRGDIPPERPSFNTGQVQTGQAPNQPLTAYIQLYVTGSVADDNLAGPLKGKGTCVLLVKLTITNETTARAEGSPPTGGGAQSSEGCIASVYNNFHASNTTIQGTRPGVGSETEQQKEVKVMINAPVPYGEAPLSVAFTMKNSTGQVIDGPRHVQKQENGGPNGAAGDPIEKKYALYTFTYKLNAGDYSFCADYVITCAPFKKVQGVPLTPPNALSFGDNPGSNIIRAKVSVNWVGQSNDPARKVGPYEISVTKISDGSTRTFLTSGKDIAAPGGDGSTTIRFKEEVSALMSPFDPEKYRVCLVVLNRCEEVEKKQGSIAEVEFVAITTDADKLLAASGAGGNAQKKTCESTGSPIAWALCAVFNGLADFSDFMLATVLSPLLMTNPVDLSPNSPQMQIWSQFRTYSNIFLVFALLVLAFGGAVGGKQKDAYAAQKFLPKLLFIGALSNVAIYPAAALIDLTNIVGYVVGNAFTAPLQDSAQFHFTLNGLQSTTILGGSVIGAGLIALLVGKGIGGALIKAVPFVLLFIVLPLVAALIGIFSVLALRQAIILGCTVGSSVGLVLFVLPNTEKYGMIAVKIFTKALLVYIIIMAIFGVSDLASVLIVKANGLGDQPILTLITSGAVSNVMAAIIAFLFLFLPWFMILYAFRLAGGIIGAINDFVEKRSKQGIEGIKGNANDPLSLRNKSKRSLVEGITRAQARVIGQGDSPTASVAAQLRARVGRTIGGNVDEREARYNKQASERQEALVADGPDDMVYAAGGWTETRPDGSTLYRDSKGREISKGVYKAGKSRYGTGKAAMGKSLSYALKKAQTDDDLANFRTAFSAAAIENNWDQNEAMGVWAAATYGHKGMYASEWYSKPEVQTDANGRTTGVKHNDVVSDQDAYSGMSKDIHRTRQSFTINAERDKDFRTMYKWQKELEDRVDPNGTYDYNAAAAQKNAEAAAKGSTKRVTAADLKQNDHDELVRTYENFDAITQQLQQMPNAQGPSGAPIGGVSAAGSSPASQPWVETAVAQRRFALESATHDDGTRGIQDKATGRAFARGRAGDDVTSL